MTKQKRRRRNKKSRNKNIRLLLISVFFISLYFLATYFSSPIRDIPMNSLNKEAKAVGIDVSEWQSDIDFKKVKRDGYSFVLIRTGFGWEYEDINFQTHIQNAKKAGLAVGVYHYSHATTIQEAIQEAQLVIQIIDDYSLDFPVFYDIETDRQNHLTRYELTQIVSAFLNTLENHGYHPGIYAAQSWYEDRLDMSILEKYPIWIASYTDYLSYEGKYDYWQYTSEGSVKGVHGYCDINIQY